MSSIKSDITNKSFSSRGLREVEVSDESEQVYNPEPPIDVAAINARLSSRGLPPLDNNIIQAMKNQAPQSQESISDIERKIKEQKRARFTGKEHLNEGAKRRIEMLCGFSKNTKEVTIDGNVFVLKTLKAKEMREALVSASAYDQTVNLPFETRRHLLARSLIQIADTDIELFLGDDSIEAKLDFLEELDEIVLSELFTSYQNLVNETKEKYTVKTDAEVQEVVADLKK